MAYEPVQTWELDAHRGARRGCVALRDVLVFLFAQHGATNLGIYNRRPVRGGRSWSLHAVGRAIDIGTPGADLARFIGQVLTTGDNPGGCGVMEVIADRHRWTEASGWQSYGGKDDHTTHVHVGMTIAMADNRASLPELRQWFAAVLTNPT